MGKRKKMGLEEEDKETAFKMNAEERKFFDKFNKEWSRGPSYKDGECSIKDEDFKKESHRNKNSRNRDAYSVSEKMGTLDYMANDEREFMTAASDEWEWMDVFKMIGPEEAAEVITTHAIRDLQITGIDKRTTLARYYIKMNKLRTLARKEQDIEREMKKNEKA